MRSILFVKRKLVQHCCGAILDFETIEKSLKYVDPVEEPSTVHQFQWLKLLLSK